MPPFRFPLLKDDTAQAHTKHSAKSERHQRRIFAATVSACKRQAEHGSPPQPLIAMRRAYSETEVPESHLTQSRIGVSAISRSGFALLRRREAREERRGVRGEKEVRERGQGERTGREERGENKDVAEQKEREGE
jgi:hypothetical protein